MAKDNPLVTGDELASMEQVLAEAKNEVLTRHLDYPYMKANLEHMSWLLTLLKANNPQLVGERRPTLDELFKRKR